jgi:hypothetical protein
MVIINIDSLSLWMSIIKQWKKSLQTCFKKKKSLQTSRDGIEKYMGKSGPYVYFLSRLFQSVGTLPWSRPYPGEVFTVYRPSHVCIKQIIRHVRKAIYTAHMLYTRVKVCSKRLINYMQLAIDEHMKYYLSRCMINRLYDAEFTVTRS